MVAEVEIGASGGRQSGRGQGIKKQTKVYSNFLFIKCSRYNFISLPAFYLVMCLINVQKNFGKIVILKI